MKQLVRVPKKLFEGVVLTRKEQNFLELIRLDEKTLYRKIGAAGKETESKLKVKDDFDRCPNKGDLEGKSPFFFQYRKIESSVGIHCNLPADDLEAGEIIVNHMGVHFDKIICNTVRESPLFGYKQEAVRLGTQCVDALVKNFPMIDERIIKSFVALRSQQMFNICPK
ncbi:MAG TPA: hypothetical protein PLI53_02915 [Geobacteraceae bacterium]|nr:hypothetical protein [Geobacteraceae bacterium]